MISSSILERNYRLARTKRAVLRECFSVTKCLDDSLSLATIYESLLPKRFLVDRDNTLVSTPVIVERLGPALVVDLREEC
jgi:hypothetical protein